MYYEFYQLRENPFNVTADPSFFYSSRHHSEAEAHLAYGIRERKGVLVVTGEVGTGKTTLCRKLLEQQPDGLHTAFVLNPNFSDIELLQVIVHDLGISSECKTRYDLMNDLKQFLLQESEKGNNVVLILDEAQNLTPAQMEQIRQFSADLKIALGLA